MKIKDNEIEITDKLFVEISRLIEQSRRMVALTVNSNLTLLYWNTGKVIKEQILHSKRAEYGDRIVLSLSKKLTETYGSGWSMPQLWNCLRSAETIPIKENINILSTELSWTHIKSLIAIKEDVKHLKWLDKYERKEGEESPIGLILCSEKSPEQIELLELNGGHIRVAEYLTQLPSREALTHKLQMAIKLAKTKTSEETNLH